MIRTAYLGWVRVARHFDMGYRAGGVLQEYSETLSELRELPLHVTGEESLNSQELEFLEDWIL